jgi:hypothetical protein
MAKPRAACPVCGKQATGRLRGGRLILRSHMLARAGTKASNWGAAIPCRGTGRAMDLPADAGITREDGE